MTQPATTPLGPETVVGSAWDAINQADERTLESLIGPQGEEQGHLRGGFARAAVAIEMFDRAMTKEYGPATAPRFASRRTLPSLRAPAGIPAEKRNTVLVGDEESGVRIELIRQDNQWRLTFDGLSALLRLRQVDFPMPNDEAIRRMNEMGEAMQSAAREVLAHQFPTADLAAKAGREALVDASRGKNAQ